MTLPQVASKTCTRCLVEKPLDAFNRQKLGKYGRRASCRDCQNKDHAEYRHSEHGRKVRGSWKKTDKGRECEQRYRDNPATKEKKSRIHRTEAYREARRERADRERFGGNRAKVLERDGHRCVDCGDTDNLHVHHKDGNGRNVPKEKQNNDMSNLVTLCSTCHTNQHNPVHHRWAKRRMSEEVVSCLV